MMWRIVLPCLVVALSSASAQAQTFELLVASGENHLLSSAEHEDIAEESAWLAEDFGGFNVTRWYQLPGLVPRATADTVRSCGADASCYVDALFGSRFDYVLVVNASMVAGEVVVDYLMIDTKVGVLATQTTAYLPSTTDFSYLMVPCHDALKVAPNWVGPTHAPPPPPQIATPTPAYVPTQTFGDDPDRRPLGNIGKIGAYTAAGGAAFLVGGVLVGFGADETQQEIQSEPHPQQDLETLQSRGQRRLRAANSMMVIGGVALAGGVSLLIVDRIKGSDHDLALGTNGQSVWLRGSF